MEFHGVSYKPYCVYRVYKTVFFLQPILGVWIGFKLYNSAWAMSECAKKYTIKCQKYTISDLLYKAFLPLGTLPSVMRARPQSGVSGVRGTVAPCLRGVRGDHYYQRRQPCWSRTDSKFLPVQVLDKFLNWLIKTSSKPGHIGFNGPWSQILGQILQQRSSKGRKNCPKNQKTLCQCWFCNKRFCRCGFLSQFVDYFVQRTSSFFRRWSWEAHLLLEK